MKEDIEKIAQDIHSLANRFMVIDRAFDVFMQQFPEHRLTKIGKNSIQDAKDLVNNIKVSCNNLLEENASNNTESPIEPITISPAANWYSALLKKQTELEEMFPLKISFIQGSDKYSFSGEYPSVYDEVFFNLIEYIAVLGGTQVSVDLMDNKNTFLAITDNATESVDEACADMQSIISFCNKIDAALEFKSIPGIGNNIKIIF